MRPLCPGAPPSEATERPPAPSSSRPALAPAPSAGGHAEGCRGHRATRLGTEAESGPQPGRAGGVASGGTLSRGSQHAAARGRQAQTRWGRDRRLFRRRGHAHVAGGPGLLRGPSVGRQASATPRGCLGPPRGSALHCLSCQLRPVDRSFPFQGPAPFVSGLLSQEAAEKCPGRSEHPSPTPSPPGSLLEESADSASPQRPYRC